ncbi:SHOCT domain-containing protein [Cellulomonas sp. P22]|uniref:SHOCT domain-containing protein n=1 Tax=Cellulomonas sp. P22 TaxID=3373189 RepID=UPI003792ABD2
MVRRRSLFGTVARTAVVAKTATAVSARERERQAAAADQRAQAAAPVAPVAPAPPEAPAPSGSGDRIAQLQALGELRASGVLTEAEFAAEKARILAG